MAREKRWDFLLGYEIETDDGYDYVSEDTVRMYGLQRPLTRTTLKDEIDTEVSKYNAINKESPITYTSVEAAGIDFSKYNADPKTYRGSPRRTLEDAEWARDIKRRDKYTCQACGVKGIPMHAHHIESYGWNRDLRLDLDNGVTLCVHCHTDFHERYGRRNNNREQFEEWMATMRG